MALFKFRSKLTLIVSVAVLLALLSYTLVVDKRSSRSVSVPGVGTVTHHGRGVHNDVATRGTRAQFQDQGRLLQSSVKQQRRTAFEPSGSEGNYSSVNAKGSRNRTWSKFNISGNDVMVFLHIQKTSGSMFGLHLMDTDVKPACRCSVAGYQTWLVEMPTDQTLPSLVHKCTCPRTSASSRRKEQWLFSRYTFGWPCGVHADWTLLKKCVPSVYKGAPKQLVFHYITLLRHPVDRFLSEYEHVLHGAVWKESRTILSCRDKTFYLTECYSKYSTNGSFSLEQFLDCPYNAAKNRQTLMLADWNLIPCKDMVSLTVKESILLKSAIKNLGEMAYFALVERQNESMVLFEQTFGLHFKHPFQQRSRARKGRYTADQLSRVEAANKLDMQLYKHANKLFNKRLQKL